MNMDFQEGYCDGLAGHMQQPWQARGVVGAWQYLRGYALGALDRIAMTNGVIAAWCDGLCDGDA